MSPAELAGRLGLEARGGVEWADADGAALLATRAAHHGRIALDLEVAERARAVSLRDYAALKASRRFSAEYLTRTRHAEAVTRSGRRCIIAGADREGFVSVMLAGELVVFEPYDLDLA